jgi:aspartyl-tRNA(Asn)/glutamyl-tRNA(Gln) amidotransferase subunit C
MKLCVMAQLSLKEVEEIALLARLALAPEEAERLRSDLSSILGYIDKLRACDTTGVEPMTHAVPMDCPLRPDDPRGTSLPTEAALAAAPRQRDEHFEVPRVIEQER